MQIIMLIVVWLKIGFYFRFLLSAEMLKPTTPINMHEQIPEETSEYYPHVGKEKKSYIFWLL